MLKRVRHLGSTGFSSRAVRQFLWSKYYKTTTKEGAHVVAVALNLQRQYPNLSGPELIRLAYWGASGSTED